MGERPRRLHEELCRRLIVFDAHVIKYRMPAMHGNAYYTNRKNLLQPLDGSQEHFRDGGGALLVPCFPAPVPSLPPARRRLLFRLRH